MRERKERNKSGGYLFLSSFVLWPLHPSFVISISHHPPFPAHQTTKKTKEGDYNCCDLFTLEKAPILRLKLDHTSF
jgi:hypothetical protein